MAYIRTKTIKGKQYRYLQESYRSGGKVRTRSKYLGPVGRELVGVALLGPLYIAALLLRRSAGDVTVDRPHYSKTRSRLDPRSEQAQREQHYKQLRENPRGTFERGQARTTERNAAKPEPAKTERERELERMIAELGEKMKDARQVDGGKVRDPVEAPTEPEGEGEDTTE